MSLYQLQELASRQQEQINSTQRLIENKEQRLNYLASVQDCQQRPIFDYDQNLSHFKEKISLQEAKIRKLQLLKGQIQKQRSSNSNMCSEVETIKILFKEKERELTVALTKIDALSRQLDELKKGNIINSYSINGYKAQQTAELEKLRHELLHKNKISKQHDEELIYKRNMLYKKQSDMMKIDQKVTELKSRLARKRQLNQQLMSSQMNGARGNGAESREDLFASKTILRSSMGHPATYKVPFSRPSACNNSPTQQTNIPPNIATVEPLQRLKGAMLKQYDFSQPEYGLASQANKQDPKYQTLPYNTKFGGRNLSANFSSSKQLEESPSGNVNARNFAAMSEDCDSVPSANDISLIISHKSDSSKDTSLEERPSPSGSSGSSDRISSSMTAYSYSDKMGLNGHSPDNRYFSNLDKSYRRAAEECGSHAENNLYSPSKYVPNLSSGKSTTENGAKDGSTTSSALDAFYKTKPSAPVKPIASEVDVVDNCRYESNFMFSQKSHRSSGENSTLSTPTSGVYSSSEIFSPHDKNGSDTQMDFEEDSDDNMRNQKLEENRSSVSEIVSRLNNWSVSNGSHGQDWEKMKRRPVVSANEMEKELTQEANAKTAAANGGLSKDKPTGDGKESKNTKNSPERNYTKSKAEQDLANNNSNTNNNNTENGFADTDTTTERKELSKPKRIKGSLKGSQDSNGRKMKIPLGRRVSFDPLALLLDASLEGELELVKKTSHEVPNPSASNDEGITALHNATCAGHFEIVKYLVEIGCDVNVQDSDGWTPLHCAASCNNLVMIKFLVQSGACIFATTFSDHETAAEKCEEDEEGFDGCSQFLYGVQEQLGSINGGMVYALYDYESQNPDELNFKVGDGIQVLRKGDDQEKEWWWSKIGDYEGYIPRNLIGMYPRIQPSYH